MATVKLFVWRNNRWDVVYRVDLDLVKQHLRAVSRILDTQTDADKPYDVYLHNVSSGPLTWVLNHLYKRGHNLHLHVRDHKLPQAIAIYQAVRALDAIPEQPHVSGHIVGHISHNKVTPEDLAAVQTAFRNYDKQHRFWQALISQLGWYLVRDWYNRTEEREILKLIEKDTELERLVRLKREELIELKASYPSRSTKYPGYRNRKPDLDQPTSSREQVATPRFTEPDGSMPFPLIADRGDSAATAASHAHQSTAQDRPALPPAFNPVDARFGVPLATGDVLAPRASGEMSGVHGQAHMGGKPKATGGALKPFQLLVRNLEDVELSDSWKGVPAITGVEQIRIQVTVDDSKLRATKLDEKIEGWYKDMADVFRKNG